MATASPFVWGSGGEPLTPEEAKARREDAARIIAQATAGKPVQHWTQGLANVGQAALAALDAREATAGERIGRELASKELAGLAGSFLGGGGATPAAAAPVTPPGGRTLSDAGGAAAPDSTVQAGSGAVGNALDLIMKHESAGRNVKQNIVPEGGGYNPSTGTVTGPSSASGYWQMINPTWRNAAKSAGIDISQYPTAMSAPYDVQRKVASALFAKEGFGPWAPYNAALRGAIAKAGGAGAFSNDSADVPAPSRIAQALSPAPEASDDTTPAAGGPVRLAQAGATDAPTLPAAQFLVTQAKERDPANQPTAGQRIAQALPASAPAAAPQGNSRDTIARAMKIMESPYANAGQKQVAGAILQKALTAETPNYSFPTVGNQVFRANPRDGSLTPVMTVPQDPLDTRQKQINIEKGERDLLPDGARPLTEAERKQFGFTSDQAGYYDTKAGKPVAIGSPKTVINNAVNPILKGLGDSFVESANVARAQGEAIRSIHSARSQLDENGGIISGAGADTKLALQKMGAALGVADPRSIVNTETFKTQIKPIVLETVKGLGAGSGISNADREFALEAVGGSTTLDQGTIRRVLEITERAARAKIARHNAIADQMLAQQPDLAGVGPMLKIEAPGDYAKPSIDDLLKKYGGR